MQHLRWVMDIHDLDTRHLNSLPGYTIMDAKDSTVFNGHSENAIGNMKRIEAFKYVIFDEMHEQILMRIKNLDKATKKESHTTLKWVFWYFSSSWIFFVRF